MAYRKRYTKRSHPAWMESQYDGPGHLAGDVIWFDPRVTGEGRATSGAAAVTRARAFADQMALHFGIETTAEQDERERILGAVQLGTQPYPDAKPEPTPEPPPRKPSPPQMDGVTPLGFTPIKQPSISDEIAAIAAEAAMDEAYSGESS